MMVSAMILVAASLVSQPPEPATKAELAQRAAAETKRTREIRLQRRRVLAAQAFAKLPLREKRNNPQWMATVEYMTNDAGHQQAKRYVPLDSRSTSYETAKQMSDASAIAAWRNNAPTRYDVYFKDGAHEIYDRSGFLMNRIPAPKRLDKD